MTPSRSTLPAIALVASTLIASIAFVTVKLHRPTTIDVRGSAKRRISSDLAQWGATVSATKPTRTEAYAALKKDVGQLAAFLEKNGVPSGQHRASAVTVVEVTHDEVKEDGPRVLRRTVSDGWRAQQRIE